MDGGGTADGLVPLAGNQINVAAGQVGRVKGGEKKVRHEQPLDYAIGGAITAAIGGYPHLTPYADAELAPPSQPQDHPHLDHRPQPMPQFHLRRSGSPQIHPRLKLPRLGPSAQLPTALCLFNKR